MALRVAYVLGTTAGGTGYHVAMLATGCVKAGCEVRAFGPADVAPLLTAGRSAGPGGRSAAPGETPAPPWPEPPRSAAASPADDRIEFEPVPIADRPRPASDLAAIRRLRRRLAAMDPDVVHAHGLRAGALAALALRPAPAMRWPAGRLPPLVVTVHNAPPASAGAAAIYAVLERLVARRADAVLCVSPDLSARMRRRGADDVERAIVPARLVTPAAPAAGGAKPGGAVPGRPALAGPWPAELGADGRPVVLAVARLAPQKGLDTLLAAAATAQWRARRPEPLVVIAGTGPLARALAASAQDLGVPATFLGWRADVPALLGACAVCVLPSRWEGQPLIVQEALRAGRPIVASDVGGVRDLTGDAALLVPPGDPAALAAAVLGVLDDAGLAGRLAATAAARAATLPTEADAVTDALGRYERLAAAAGRWPPPDQAPASSRRYERYT